MKPARPVKPVAPPQTADEMIVALRGSIARAHALAAKKPCARCAKFSAVARPAVCQACREGA